MSEADDLVEVRMLVPRSALVQAPPAPELVSQATCDRYGLTPRRYLEIVRRVDFPGRVLRAGRLRLVRPADLITALERLDAEERASETAETPPLAERLRLRRKAG